MSPTAVTAAAVVAAITFWRLRSTVREERALGIGSMLIMGIAAFALGHAVFLLVPDIMFAPTGMANRALSAAALGVALIYAAILAFACSWVGTRRSKWLLPACSALLAFAGVLRVCDIASYWAAVPAVQQKVLDAARSDLRDLPRDATVILDGVCPYYGPAVAFEAAPDVSGSLSLALGRWIRADAISNRARLTREGLQTSIYGESSTYRFGPTLYVYDPRRRLLATLNGEAAARSYFRDPSRPELACARGYVGQGVLI